MTAADSSRIAAATTWNWWPACWGAWPPVIDSSAGGGRGTATRLVDDLHELRLFVQRVPGTAVFLNRGRTTTPLAMRSNVEHNHVLRSQRSAFVVNAPHSLSL
jgi:hypothetical protein